MSRFAIGTVLMLIVWSSGQVVAQEFHFDPGDVLRAQDLNELGASLTGANTDGVTDPPSIVVDCGAGQTIGAALLTALPGSTLLLTGTCNETVTITTDGLTLDGQGTTVIDGGGFPPGNVAQGVITIDGARRVTLKNLTVRNGPDGVLALRGAAVILEQVIAENNADEGIQIIDNSTAQLADCTAQNNGDNGILVSRTSSVTFWAPMV